MKKLLVGPRPSIPEALKEACPERDIHLWQVDDPSSENGVAPQWLNLPRLLQEFADRTFAKYQLDLTTAIKKFEAGAMKEPKLRGIEKNCVRPFVLMQGTGQPATARYIKERLITDASGTQRLKVWARAVSMKTFPFK